MRAQFIKEAQEFTRGEDPLDSLQVGRIEERKWRGLNSFMDWLHDYRYSSKDVVRVCYYSARYIGDSEKEKLIFQGHPIYEIYGDPELEDTHNYIAQECFSLEYWPIAIRKLLFPDMTDEEEDELEDTYDDNNFLDNMVVYFIDKWPGEIKEIKEIKGIKEAQEFKREGTPYEKMGIGKSRYRPYPQMTPDEFATWYKNEIEPYYEKEFGVDMVIDNIWNILLINDESSTDKELSDYWMEYGATEDLINKLRPMRPYFWDSRYLQKIGY